jgi:glycine hydroxymethyltransferase
MDEIADADEGAGKAPTVDVELLRRGVLGDIAANAACLSLTANESFMSDSARAFMSSELSDRYFSGPGDEDGVVSNPYGPFMSRGLPGVSALVDAAEAAARDMLGAAIVSLSCLSGVHAMTCVLLALSNPGDTVVSLGVPSGGHFGTQTVVERTGRRHLSAPYDLDALGVDLDALAVQFRADGARLLYLDSSYYLNPHDLRGMREAVGPDAAIVYDASHTLGLIMGGTFQQPLREGADVICGNTHKTLPGPHKGLIAFRDPDVGRRALNVIDAGLYSSPHLAHLVPLAVTILEMQAFGRAYAAQVVANAVALAEELAESGFEVRRIPGGAYTRNHQIHVFPEAGRLPRDIYAQLLRSNIVIGFDNALGGRPYMRLGVQQVTRRGMHKDQMRSIAGMLRRGIAGANLQDEVTDLMQAYQKARYSFDGR